MVLNEFIIFSMINIFIIIRQPHVCVAGASSDFQTATRIATAMVKRFGMSEKVGMRCFDESDGADTGVSFVKVNDISPALQEQVDMEIKRLLQVHTLTPGN
jgi:ATP-dependent Zn protease